NELLAATIGAFVGPGTPVIFPRPTFTLYEKLVTIAGGLPIPIEFEPDSGLLPLEEILGALASSPAGGQASRLPRRRDAGAPSRHPLLAEQSDRRRVARGRLAETDRQRRDGAVRPRVRRLRERH